MPTDGPDPAEPASPPCFVVGGSLREPAAPGEVGPWRQGERRRLLAARSALPAEARARIAEALAGHLDALLRRRLGDLRGRVVSGYWPIKGEPDLRAWMAELAGRGAILALPVVEHPDAPLVFRAWAPGQPLARGRWQVPEPPEEAPRLLPEVALAPLLGWDGAGFRLGHGTGLFDRTLAALAPRPVAVGVGLQSARLPSIHPQPHDIPLDAIVTEAGPQFERMPGRAGPG